jgi:hypothetical protein
MKRKGPARGDEAHVKKEVRDRIEKGRNCADEHYSDRENPSIDADS